MPPHNGTEGTQTSYTKIHIFIFMKQNRGEEHGSKHIQSRERKIERKSERNRERAGIF